MGEFAIKVSPFGGEYGGAQRCGSMRACGGGDANLYWFMSQPIVVGGTGANHYLFVVQTTIGL